jgi:hypothetical protein
VDFAWRLSRRQLYVAKYVLPAGLGQEIHRRSHHVGSFDEAYRALRQWLRLNVVSRDLLAIPSLAVDILWHDFILDTKSYDQFCRKAYGRKMQHRPEISACEAATADFNGHAMARTFALACKDEGIRPTQPTELPILFRVDREMHLPDGKRWVLQCHANECRTPEGVRCVWHELVPLVPDRLPKLLALHGSGRVVTPTRWEVDAPFPGPSYPDMGS